MAENNGNNNGQPFSEREFTNYICRGLNDAIRDRKEFDELIDKWWKDWRDIKDVKVFPWKGCSNWSVPITSTSTDSVIPRIVEGVMDIDPPVEIIPLNSTSNQFKDIIKQFVIWDIRTHPELLRDIWFVVQNTAWSGTGYIKSFFEKEREIDEEEFRAYINTVTGEIASDPNTGIPLEITSHNTMLLEQTGILHEIRTVTKKVLKWKKYNPNQTVIGIKDIIFPSDCDSIQDAWDNSWLAVRVHHTKDFLYRKLKQDEKELYKNLDKIKIKGLESKVSLENDTQQREEISKYYSKTKKIEDFEVYINYDVDGDGLNEKVVAIVNLQQKLLFGWEKFPYEHKRCPIIPCYIKPIHNQPYGIGIPEMLYDIKGEIDAEHNQRSDRRSLSINPVLMHTEDSGFNPNIHKLGIGRQWRLSKITTDAVGFLQPPKYERDSIEEENLNLAYGQKRTGITDYALGSESAIASNKTATGIMALIREGNVGFRNFIRWVSLSLSEFFNQRMALYQQYWGEAADEEVKQWIREIMDIPDNPLAMQGIEAIRQKFNIVMTAFKEDKQLELTKAQVAYDVVSNNPLVQQFPLALKEITIDLLRKAGVQDPESKLPTEQQIRQWQVEIQKEAMRQLEAEKAEQNVQEAMIAGEKKETAKQQAMQELVDEVEAASGRPITE